MTTLSNQIRNSRAGAAYNPFQGVDKKVLFVCSMGILRSATGARLYAHKYNTRCAGTYEEALIQVTPLLLEWADEIVFVNEENFNAVVRDEELNPLLEARPFKILDIPDEFEHMHPALIDAFEQQYEVLG